MPPFPEADAREERGADEAVPRVSVVMPVYNGEEHLDDAIASILNQTFEDLELIVLDDGSTDGTPARLDAWTGRDPRVRVHRLEHGGIVAALNRGCALARAPYLARMDADDLAFPDRLAKQVGFLDQHPDIAAVGGSIEYVLDEGRRIRLKSVPTDPSEIASRLLAGKHCFVHPTVVMRKGVFEAAGGYRASFEWAEDYDLWLRMAERSDLANIADAVLTKRVHSSQLSAQRMEQGIVRFLGAQAAARIRRVSGRDPIGDEPVTRATLERLGVSEEIVREHVVQAYKNHFRAFREAGNPAGALRLFREHSTSWRVRRALRNDYTHALLRQAKRDWGESRWLKGLLSAARACLAQPSLPVTRLAARARSVLAGRNRGA
jgi:glycosyltransferase involved in cell wall biosynthesis